MKKEVRSSKYHVVWISKYKKSFLKGNVKK